MGESPLDLMTFLQQKYEQMLAQELVKNKNAAHMRDKHNASLAELGLEPTYGGFIAFARKYLAEINQPLNVCFMPRGLGLRMQHGETVGFIVEPPERTQMHDEGIHITRPRTVPGMHGVSDISSVQVFGGR